MKKNGVLLERQEPKLAWFFETNILLDVLTIQSYHNNDVYEFSRYEIDQFKREYQDLAKLKKPKRHG